MKIYIVTSGDYSDYSIRAVFTSKDLADEYVSNQVLANGIYDIEEYDSDIQTKLMTVYSCSIDLRDGSIKDLDSVKIVTDDFLGRSPKPYIDNYKFNNFVNFNGYCPKVYRIESYESFEHAHKLAVELKQNFDRTIDKKYLIDNNKYSWNYIHPEVEIARNKNNETRTTENN